MRAATRLLAAAALLGLSPAILSTTVQAAAISGQISIGGYVDPIGSSTMSTATGLDFVSGALGTASPGVAGGVTSYGAGTGTFAGLACASVAGACGAIMDITSFSSSTAIADFLTLYTSTGAITFDLGAITSVTQASDATGGSLVLTATGTLHDLGYADTAAVFTLTTQGNAITSFSATALSMGSAVPEPSIWAMMLIGFGAIGAMLRARPRSRRMALA